MAYPTAKHARGALLAAWLVSQPQLRVPALTLSELPKTATLASDWLCIPNEACVCSWWLKVVHKNHPGVWGSCESQDRVNQKCRHLSAPPLCQICECYVGNSINYSFEVASAVAFL